MSRFLNLWCPTMISKKKMNATLDVSDTLALTCVRHLMFSIVSEKTTPRTVRAVPRRLTKTLIEVTVMADQQHTKTHPKFTWLFLATPKSHPECSPVVLRFDTDTEENARAAFPGWEMVFAAKIRAEAPCRVAFFDYNTRRGWAFDSASDREVVGHD
ncbi:host cell division inhibitor Icd-like protein [Klebsiella pneumoniae]|nr:host cell division inhibitor Icd-like protein [Klebsiella pneumoniae]